MIEELVLSSRDELLGKIGFVVASSDGLLVTVAGVGLNAADLTSVGTWAAVLCKQLFEVHAFGVACGEGGQAHPIKGADRAPMRRILMQSPPRG